MAGRVPPFEVARAGHKKTAPKNLGQTARKKEGRSSSGVKCNAGIKTEKGVLGEKKGAEAREGGGKKKNYGREGRTRKSFGMVGGTKRKPSES